jgi:hypothetical protein
VDRTRTPATLRRTTRLEQRTARRRNAGTVASGLLLAAGIAIGLLPFSVKDAPCGSAFVQGEDAFAADLEDTWSDAADIADNAAMGSHQDGCGGRRTVMRAVSLGLAAVGTVGLLAVVRGTRRSRSASG